MIQKQEILEIAKNSKLSPHVIEKDYVLGWLLGGIAQNQELFNNWIFKGGTCLKKCYFDSYRMSEDLDFTLKSKDLFDRSSLENVFSQISKWVYASSGIKLPEDRMIFDFYENPRGKLSCEGRIFYHGPLAPASPQQTPRIKLDLSIDEIIVEAPVTKRVDHKYSDLPSGHLLINCYSYIEIFSEKIRALADRTRPRDLYDVIHFFRRPESKGLSSEIRRVLTRKCEFKDIQFPTYSNIEINKDICLIGWKDQLSHQLPALPTFESFWEELGSFFNWLENAGQKREALPEIAGDLSRDVISDIRNQGIEPPKINMLERIQFASANHLCIEVTYRQPDKKHHQITIEPYSLRRTQDRNIWICAQNHHTKEKIYLRIDDILKVDISNGFIPSFQVDFLPKCQL